MSYTLVVIGTSLGGLHALTVLLSGLPGDFPAAIVVVQHRSGDSDDMLVDYLQQACALRVKDAEDKESILAGQVYLAPAEYHLLVEAGHCALSTDAPVNAARPSIDVLFESAADAYRDQVIGVILTGASADGAQGAACIKQRGGMLVAQDPESAERRVMPDAVIANSRVDQVLPLEKIAAFLGAACRPRISNR